MGVYLLKILVPVSAWQFTLVWKRHFAQHNGLGQKIFKKITLDVLSLKNMDLNASMSCNNKLDIYTAAQKRYSVHEWSWILSTKERERESENSFYFPKLWEIIETRNLLVFMAHEDCCLWDVIKCYLVNLLLVFWRYLLSPLVCPEVNRYVTQTAVATTQNVLCSHVSFHKG
jgi:hypothetical protein